jgi:PAS domain S-box-containing protein
MAESAGGPGSIPRQARPRGFGPFIVWCLIATICLMTELLILLSSLPQSTRDLSSQILLTSGAFLVVISCARHVRNLRERRSRAWLLLALAGLFCAGANLYELLISIGQPRTTTAIGDAGLTIALLIGIFGILSFPTARRRRTDLARMVLDGVVVGGSILFLTTVVVYPPLLVNHRITSITDITALTLPIGDVVVATLAVLLIMRSGHGDRPALTLVGLGFSLYAISDLALTVQSAQQAFAFGTIVDLGWITGYALIALAGQHPAARQPASDPLRETSPVAGTVIMFAVFIAAAIVGLVGDVNPLTNTLWLIVLIAVAARQVLLIIDNNALRQGLERRVAERTRDLRRLTEQSELLLRSVGDGIYGVDPAGRITFVNPAAAKALGYPPAELIGRSAHYTFHAPQPDGTPLPENQCYVTEAVRDGFAAISEEDSYVRADGRQIAVEVTATPLTVGSASPTPDSSTRGAVVVFRDITQRREVDRMKNEFVSMVSHELRTPLTSIRGSLGLLSGGVLGDLPVRAEQLITIAQQSCERLTRLINDILDIERFESGSIPMEIGEHRAADLITNAIRQVGMVASEGGIALRVTRADGLVSADADRVLQALINLISNAVKFSRSGDEVLIAAVPRGGFVEFSITDHGRGIPPDKLDSIFNRFEQVDSSDSREKGGSGLGLAISRGIVEQLGGRIWARSDPTRGTVFTFTLPRSGQNEPSDSEEQPTVLVCDDDDYAVEVMCRMLESGGLRPIGVTDGRQAIERALTEPPAVMIVDLAMPGTSGADVIAGLARHSSTKGIPIVIVSGLSPTGNPTLAGKASSWLIKPIDEERLVHAVKSALANRSRGNSTVLLAEADDGLAGNITLLLERRGLAVQRARSAADAITSVIQAKPDLIIHDIQLRDEDGRTLLTALRDRGVAGIAVVGYSDTYLDDDAIEGLPGGPSVFLTRGSVTAQQLEDNVIEMLDLLPDRADGPAPAIGFEGEAQLVPDDDDKDEDEDDEPRPRRALEYPVTNP